MKRERNDRNDGATLADNTGVADGGISARLTRALEGAGKSQNWFAHELGVSQSTLNRQMREGKLETGTVIRAAEALGVDLLWMMTGQENARANGGVASAEDVRTLEERLDAIEEMDVTEALKVLKIEALGAVIRAEALREAERAAAVRARALELAEGSASDRARALEREAEAASYRSGVLPIESALGEMISDEEIAAHLPPLAAPRRPAAQASGMRGGARTPK